MIDLEGERVPLPTEPHMHDTGIRDKAQRGALARDSGERPSAVSCCDRF